MAKLPCSWGDIATLHSQFRQPAPDQRRRNSQQLFLCAPGRHTWITRPTLPDTASLHSHIVRQACGCNFRFQTPCRGPKASRRSLLRIKRNLPGAVYTYTMLLPVFRSGLPVPASCRLCGFSFREDQTLIPGLYLNLVAGYEVSCQQLLRRGFSIRRWIARLSGLAP